ncbi:hypothetical protein CBF18_14535 [Mastigocladus laminosus WC112]|nr:hypothetical protein CBP10_14540 [Fischerella thermalis WC558]RDH49562.1 hypothetical protein CBF18_14535 [Mastigocladus laminosus WC112]
MLRFWALGIGFSHYPLPITSLRDSISIQANMISSKNPPALRKTKQGDALNNIKQNLLKLRS